MERHRLQDTPPGTRVCLLEDWCTPAEEEYLLGRVYRPSGTACDPWQLVSGRKVQVHGGEVHEKGMIPRQLPEWLGKILKSVRETCGDDMFPGNVQLNHALVNEYEVGGGIMPHQDGPLYFPAAAIVSLGATAVMRFTPHASQENVGAEESAETSSSMAPFGVWLPRRSLLFFDGAAYTHCLHGIDGVAEDVLDESVVNWRSAVDRCADTRKREGTRVSVTCRNVLKVRKLLMFK